MACSKSVEFSPLHQVNMKSRQHNNGCLKIKNISVDNFKIINKSDFGVIDQF